MTKNNLKQAQIFTPAWATNAMLDMLDQDDFAKEETLYFEPSCGNGEMLIVIIKRVYNKLLEKYDGEKEKALADCMFKFYAIELDEKLVVEARIKIFNYFIEQFDDEMDFNLLCQFIISRLIFEKIQCKDFFDFMGTKSPTKRTVKNT